LASTALAQSPYYRLAGNAHEGLGVGLERIGDTDGDGVDDVVIRNAAGWRLASGATGATRWTIPNPATEPEARLNSAALGDVDGDGVDDLLIGATFGSFGNLYVHSGATGALLRVHDGQSDLTRYGRAVVSVGDLDADGRADYGTFEASLFVSGLFLTMFSGDDGHELYSEDLLPYGPILFPDLAAIGDLDGDGRSEIAINTLSGVRVLSGVSGASLFEIPLSGTATASLRAAGDVDNDGVPDILVSNAQSVSSAGSTVFAFSGATQQLLRSFAAGGAVANPAGDVDGDGVDDIVLPGDSSSLGFFEVYSVATGARIGAAYGGPRVRAPSDKRTAILLGDVNGDGRNDFAFGDSGATPYLALDAASDSIVEGGVWVYTDLTPQSVGARYADAGPGTPCPCGNVSPTGVGGCANSTGFGASLDAFGSTSVLADSLRFELTGHPTGANTTLAVGTTALTPGIVLGDGLRAVGGALRRLPAFVQFPNSFAASPIGLARIAGWNAGQTIRFQALYRDPVGPCGSTLNMSNAIEVTFTP